MKTISAKASARKSLGEYKPIIQYPCGKSEVCEQSPERQNRLTKFGIIKGNRLARGNTYSTCQEAIDAAQKVIDIRRIEAEETRAKYALSENPKVRIEGVKRKTDEIRLWGGE